MKLQEITVPAGGQATIDFTAIVQTYKHLLVSIVGATDAAVQFTQLNVQLNGDTGTSYETEQVQGQAGGVQANNTVTTSGYLGNLAGASASAVASAGSIEVNFLHYASTRWRKYFTSAGLVDRLDGTLLAEYMAGSWRNSAAIMRVTLSLTAGNFAAGTVAQLWGIDGPAAAPPPAQATYACRIPPSFGAEATGNYEMGQRFWSDFDGVITGIAFYKSPSDTATTHTVNLWADDGVTKIGTATTSGEAAGAGWQLATFPTPLSITKATFYRATVGLTTFRWEAGAGSVARTVGPLTIYADCYASPAGSYPTTTGTIYRFVTPILAVS